MRYDRKPLVEESSKIEVGQVVRKNVLDFEPFFKKCHKRSLDLSQESDVQELSKFIETAVKVSQIVTESSEKKETKLNPIRVTYTKSNLGKGFIFWFLCNRCEARIKHLFCPSNSEDFLCRNCHRLAYRKQNTSADRLVSKLLKNVDLIPAYMQSGSHRHTLAAMEAVMFMDELRERATKKVNTYFTGN